MTLGIQSEKSFSDVLVRGFYENHPDDFGWEGLGEKLNVHSPIGMSDQYVWRTQLRPLKQPVQIPNGVPACAGDSGGVTKSQASPIIGTCLCVLGYFRLHQAPGLGAVTESGFKHDQRLATASAVQVEPSPIFNFDETLRGGVDRIVNYLDIPGRIGGSRHDKKKCRG
jgi:hypothetical protein